MVVAFLIATGLAAQTIGQDCRDDAGVDRCAAQDVARTNELYGVKSIEELARTGAQVRRVFYVDGYGRDLVAISFIRDPGKDPAAFIHFPQRAGQAASSLAAPVPNSVWSDILRRSDLFDRKLSGPISAEPKICMHAWVFRVESFDPPRADLQHSSLRRKTEDACDDGPARAYAVEVEQAALPLFPHCAHLDPRQHRNEASQLAACRLLSGDRMAAAEVMNRAVDLRRKHLGEDQKRFRGFFAHVSSIDWQGEQITMDSLKAADFWAVRLAAAGHTNFYFDRVEGLTADRARLLGNLTRTVEQLDAERNVARTTTYVAPVELAWIFGPTQSWEIERAIVKPWAIRKEP